MNGVYQWVQTGFDVVMMATFVLSSMYFMLTVFALILRRRQKALPDDSCTEFPTVTVQIPTYNELAALNCAKRCLSFDYPEGRLQILIGDDSSDPSVSARLRAFAEDHPRVKVCRRGNNAGFKPGNLNHMLQETTGEYILILDSDFLPEPDFLRRLVQPVANDSSLAGAQASWRISNPLQNFTTLTGAGIIYVIHIVILPLLRRFSQTGVFCGSGELVRTDLLIQNGGWTPGALTEDVDYSLRVIAAGRQIAYLDTLHIDCEVPYKPRDLFRQQMRWAYGVMRAFINHGRRMFRSRQTGFRTKLAAICFAGGYIMTSCLLLTLIFGIVSMAGRLSAAPEGSHAPLQMIIRTAGNILLTCGMLVSSLCASFVAGASLRSLGRLIVASLTLGVVLLFFVGKGLLKALFGLPMQWFMVRKNGNALAAT